ncbi:hypothetical protein CXG50_04180 [Pseudomonas plecoglossicida]|nr:hypothetical protein CXG50_04180 [Pseudomonas plecoglossicida]
MLKPRAFLLGLYPEIHGTCRSGLVSRKGCKAAPAFFASMLKSWGRSAALSRHKAAPTKQSRSPAIPQCFMPSSASSISALAIALR